MWRELSSVSSLSCAIGFITLIGVGIVVSRSARRSQHVAKSFVELIGNTPMVELRSLSKLTGCRVLAKLEYLNPGGSSKDRVARSMIEDAESRLLLHTGGTVVEGTSGSTGISLALVAASKGYSCKIVMPNDAATEKTDLMQQFGADVVHVPPSSIVNDSHYSNVAKRIASTTKGAFYTDQFENLSNYKAHYQTTGPEIWQQTNGSVDAFVMSAGTGGTISGVGRFLKERDSTIRVVLADPEGSVLLQRVRHGTAFAPQQAECRLERHRFDTITEGIGLDRIVANFRAGEHHIDGAVRISDQEAVDIAHLVLRKDGLFIGSSSAVNCAAVVHVARELKRRLVPKVDTANIVCKPVIVTILCDHGSRHRSKFWNPKYLREHGFRVPHT